MDSPGRAHAAVSHNAPSDGITFRVSPIGLPKTPRPTDSPERAHAAVCRSAPSDGATRQGQPHRAPPNASVQRPSPGRAASQTSAGRSRRTNLKSVFCTDMCRAKNSSQPESAGFAGAGRAASPKFGMGHPPGRQLDSLVRYPSERSPSLPGPSQISTLIPRASSQFPYGTASPSGWSGGSARPGCGPGGRHVPGRPRSTGSWGSCPRR